MRCNNLAPSANTSSQQKQGTPRGNCGWKKAGPFFFNLENPLALTPTPKSFSGMQSYSRAFTNRSQEPIYPRR
jgi:hypothetical protein